MTPYYISVRKLDISHVLLFLRLLSHQIAKVECVASKKLDEVLAYQKPSSDRSGLGYTGESSSSVNVSKEMKFVKVKEPMVPTC